MPHSYEPAPPLGDLIHRIWDSAYEPSHPRVRILPKGTVELIINLSEDEIRIYDGGEAAGHRRFPGIVVAGAYAGSLDIDPMRHARMMGVHFRPGGAFAFFGAAIGEAANDHVALEAFWGRSAAELRERLCSAATARKRFQILEQALSARLGNFSKHPAVAFALETFGPAGIGESVREVARRAELSQRKFIQVFTTQVGLTPKLFCRIRRFQHAREMVDRSAKPGWAELALGCGYYDQSHLIHDFREFSGLSPADYLGLRSRQAAADYVPLI